MSDDDTRAAPPKAEQFAPGKGHVTSVTAGQVPMLTVQDISVRLGLSEKHVRREIKRKRLVVHRFGRLVRIAPADLETYVAARRRGPR